MMNQLSSRRVVSCLALVVAGACASDTTTLPASSASAGTARTDSSSTTPAGPVASVTVSPTAFGLKPGSTRQLTAYGRDASGAYVNGRTIMWASRQSTIASVDANGIVTGAVTGSTWIVATIDGKSDSASVSVSASAPDTVVVTGSPHGVASFTLSVIVAAQIAGQDTTHTAAVQGITVSATRTTDSDGHALSSPVSLGTVTTDASGTASFGSVTGGAYTVVATPITGTNYYTSTATIAPPQVASVQLHMLLFQKP